MAKRTPLRGRSIDRPLFIFHTTPLQPFLVVLRLNKNGMLDILMFPDDWIVHPPGLEPGTARV